MNRTSSIVLLLLTLIAAAPDLAAAQDQQSPVLIKINRIVVKYRNSYAFYVPTFEFNMYFQKKFENFRSALTATSRPCSTSGDRVVRATAASVASAET